MKARKFNNKGFSDKRNSDVILEQEHYAAILLEKHIKVMRGRIKKYTKYPGLLIDGSSALKIIDSI